MKIIEIHVENHENYENQENHEKRRNPCENYESY